MRTINYEKEFLDVVELFRDESGTVDSVELAYTLFFSLKNLAISYKSMKMQILEIVKEKDE